MPDTIERTIFKLELDDSAYTAGIDRLSASTNKFAQSQAGANQKIDELKTKLSSVGQTPLTLPQVKLPKNALSEVEKLAQAIETIRAKILARKEFLLKETDVAKIKKYNQEIDDLTASLNKLQAISKKTVLTDSIETMRAKILARKEFLLTETDIGKIRKYNQEIDELTVSLNRAQNIGKKGFDAMGNAIPKVTGETEKLGQKTSALNKGWSFFRQMAYLLPGIGIAGMFNLIGDALGAVISKLFQAGESTNALVRQTKLLKEVETEQAKQAGSQIAQLEVLYKVATNTTLSIKERKYAVDELQKQYPEYFKALRDEIILQGQAKHAYDLTKAAILEAAKTRAIESKLSELATQDLEADQEKKELVSKQEKNRIQQEKADRKDGRDAETRGLDQFNAITKKGELLAAVSRNDAKKKRIQEDRKFLLDQVNSAKTTTKAPAASDSGKAALQNDFEKRKADLLSQISALAAKEYETELTIKKQYKDKLNKALLDIDQDKSITPKQKAELKRLAGILNDAELDKAILEYKKKVTEARQKLNQDLEDLHNNNIKDQINLIQDEFAKRAQLIEFNEKKELTDLKRSQEEKMAALKKQKDAGILDVFRYYVAVKKITTEGEIATNNIVTKYAGERKDLAADKFKESLDALKNIVEGQLLQFDEQAADQIKQQVAALNAGTINYKKFEEQVTRIKKEQKDRRDKLRLAELNTELQAINTRLQATITAAEREDLLQRQRNVRSDIAAINSQTPVDPNKKKKESLADYAQAIGNLTESIISFWQKANEAEAAALDRSISLQEKRVEAAQRIAERGNASYLKAEEDRLKELQVKRENAARRELAINAALQSSQLLVGITGAIAKIATPGIGIAETIGAIAVIFSALATGYGLVKSLQGNQPRLAQGTTYLQRGKNKPGTDTIPALLNEGEAVIPTGVNKKYHPTIEAIYHGRVPAEQLNNFVNYYHRLKPIPQVNYERMGQAAQVQISSDGQMAVLLSDNNKKLSEQNELTRQTLRALKSMGVNVSMDKNGLAVSVMEVADQILKDKKS